MIKARLIDKYLSKYTRMSERELSHQIQTNLWFTPVVYVFISFLLLSMALTTDLHFKLGTRMRHFFSVDYDLTQALVSTLTAAILALITVTFNLILLVFTTFSGQFSPRMLKNFIASKSTQRVLGIFTASFFYVLLSFLTLNKRMTEQYFAIPIFATLLAALPVGTFIFFINHTVSWLQVNKMTDEMKKESLSIVERSLQNELDPFRIKDLEKVRGMSDQIRKTVGTQIKAGQSGYIQLIDFVTMIHEAQKDDIIIELEYTIGNYVFETTPILTYWKKEETTVDELKYLALFSFGKRQTEVQDIEFSINKLVEVAIRSVGNYDPKTATNAIYQLGELLSVISRVANFNPYLADDEYHLRLILKEKDFSYYLYNGLGYIRHYAKDNVIVGTDILRVLDLMAKSINPRDYKAIWDFAVYTAQGFENQFLFQLDIQRFNQALFNLSVTTKHQEEYERLRRGADV